MKFPLYYFLVIIFIFPAVSFAAIETGKCSADGYTIATINGVLTDKDGAINNMEALMKKVGFDWNNQKIKYEYLLNPSHFGGVADLFDSIIQKAFGSEVVADYDLIEMLDDASKKIKTQKLLLVAHSQGNFYANSFYDVVADQAGGIPKQSMGVYGVATPASRVAGGGKWLTSDTDHVISGLVGHLSPLHPILPTNIHIAEVAGGINPLSGHSFSDVYLKYSGSSSEIITKVGEGLSSLSSNTTQDTDAPCMSPPMYSFSHKLNGAVFAVADTVIGTTEGAFVASYNTCSDVAVGTYYLAVNTAVWGYHASTAVGNAVINTTVAVGSAISNTAVAVGSGIRDAVGGLLSENINPASNTASVIGAIQTPLTPALPPPQTAPSALTPNIIQTPLTPALPPPVVIAGQRPNLPQLPSTPQQIAGGGSSNPQPMSFGGGSIQQPASPAVATSTEDSSEPPATSTEEIIIPDGIVFATTSAQTYSTSTVIFSGEYHNSTSTFDTIAIELKNTSLDTATSSVIISAEATTTSAVLSFHKEVEIPSPGIWQYRTRLESSVSTSSTNWSAFGYFETNFATTTTATNTPVPSTTFAMVFETPNPANILYSDLNKNGIADSVEENVTASSSAWLAAGEYVFNNLTITNNAVITAAGNENSTNTFKGVKIFAKNLTVERGSSVSANGQGYRMGPGSPPQAGTGSDPAASYGGGGGGVNPPIYGSATRPVDLGSGMGPRGGGAVQIVVTDSFVNDGIISANGSGTRASGGSIYVVANNFAGTGMLSANGSYANWPYRFAGGGGRIAVHYASSSFSGSAVGAGTAAFFDDTHKDLYIKNSFRFQKNDEPLNYHNIYLTNGASVSVDSGVSLSADKLVLSGGSYLSFSNGDVLNIPEIILDGASTLVLSGGEKINTNTLSVLGGSAITGSIEKTLSLEVANLTVSSGSSISANGQGYNMGPGSPPQAGTGSDPAASYGGGGGGVNPPIYGSATRPVDLGSGMGPRGGGAVQIVVTDSFVNDGIISANGSGTRASGGSIYVVANNFAGTGMLSANGSYANWPYRFAGGGGRIAVHYASSSFSGSAVGAGTAAFFDDTHKDLYIKNSFRFQKNDEPLNYHNIYLTNGASVEIEKSATLTADTISLAGGARFTMSDNSTVNANNLSATSSSFVTIGSGVTLNVPTMTIGKGSTLTLMCADPLIVDSLILKDGGKLGAGAGQQLRIVVNNLDIGVGSSVSAWTTPTVSDPDNFFASGERASVYIKSSGKFINNGGVSANGPAGKVGGSVYVEASELEGAGSFVSAGGSMVWCGWNCGFIIPSGGRVAVYYQTSSYTGVAVAPGACGSLDGWSKTCAGNGKVVIDNISNKPAIVLPPPPVILSSEKSITAFSLQVSTSTISGVIDETTHTISLTVPFGTDVHSLSPAISVPALATSSPASGAVHDFTNPVTYTVTAENGMTQVYTVTVIISQDTTPPVVLSTEKSITAFSLQVSTSTIPGVIDETVHTISLTVPFGIDVRTLTPAITLSPLATSSPSLLSSQDFTNPVSYTVTAENGSTQVYTVTVTVAPDTTPPPVVLDTTPPSILSYTFNGVAGDVVADFATTTPADMELELTASESVDWVSVAIQDISDPSKDKIFYSGTGCVDGTVSCSKSWNWVLSGATTTVPVGTYRIKAHIKDSANNEFNDYLSPYFITVRKEVI
ncbi:MAG: DUF5018 domain-containing protein [Candidatus Paceibacterota bacterium]|jgi:hypothetical protein